MSRVSWRRMRLSSIFVLSFNLMSVVGFVPAVSTRLSSITTNPTISTTLYKKIDETIQQQRQPHLASFIEEQHHAAAASLTRMNVWWFGGTEQNDEVSLDENDSCELVAVRIERTSPNSRRISGDIVVPTSMQDVWSILTDYNRLSTHVPNLVESKIMSTSSRNNNASAGDGSFQCRLYQKGAQKIVGFEFGADVTMDMTEQIVSDTERLIHFKCADSFFFSEFDGSWRVVQEPDETKIYYTVHVRPKGPVPVAALEWRIREDVPTNLRAVKRAAVKNTLTNSRATATVQRKNNRTTKRSMAPVRVSWLEDETMAAYMQK